MAARRKRTWKRQKEYMELLRDPRWQKMRLELFEEACWQCEWCEGAARNLQVHHGYYDRRRQKKPWEYSRDSLFVLCERCHEAAESLRLDVLEALGYIEPWYQHHICGFIEELAELLDNEEELSRMTPAGSSGEET